MLSDEEKDNVFKISVPIITNEELERFEYSLETDLDNIVNEISAHISRDREIILLKKVIEKQQKEIEELKEKNKFLNWYFENQKENFIHKDKIKAKIEFIKSLKEKFYYEENVISILQSLLEKE